MEVHDRGELHRDLKPANVFLALVKNSKGKVIRKVARIGDFGLAR